MQRRKRDADHKRRVARGRGTVVLDKVSWRAMVLRMGDIRVILTENAVLPLAGRIVDTVRSMMR
jgi:hypothetical protein